MKMLFHTDVTRSETGESLYIEVIRHDGDNGLFLSIGTLKDFDESNDDDLSVMTELDLSTAKALGNLLTSITTETA